MIIHEMRLRLQNTTNGLYSISKLVEKELGLNNIA
jgi:hypothetical protein